MTTNDLRARPLDTLPRDASPQQRGLSPSECRHRLAQHAVARLGFETGRGPRSVVVGYDVAVEGDADEVLLLLPEYHPATGYVVGAPVTIEVEDRTDGGWEVVRATGIAYLGTDGPSRTRPYGALWPAGVATHEVHVPIARVECVVRAA